MPERLHLSLAFFLLILISLSGCIKSPSDDTRLSIDTIDISAEHVRSASIDINVTTYVRNYGDIGTKNTSLLLKVYNDRTGLVEMQERSRIGAIDAGKTVSVTQSLDLPKKEGYELQLSLYEGDVRKDTGSRSIFNLEEIQANVMETGVVVGEIDFLVRNTSGKQAVIESDIYFTNEGSEPSNAYDCLVKAREIDARLIADKKWVRIPPIKPEATIIKSVNLTVPDQYNYLIEVLVWSNDTLTGRGEGTVMLRPVVVLSEGQRVETRSVDTGRFAAENFTVEAAPSAEAQPGFGERMAPGPGGFAALIAMVSALVLWRRYDRR